jgi:geranylgeranyl diphosphate synthase type I
MDITQKMQMLKEQIDLEIAQYLDQVIKEARGVDAFMTDVITHFKKTILAGGKRIRPIMMYWGYIAAGGKNEQEIIKTSISLELIHAFLLIHDDIIDRDDIRHGQKTIHATYRDHYNKFFSGDDGEHFGTAVAIVSGDFVYSLGNQVIFSSAFSSDVIVKALNKMQEIVGLTCVGEIQDVYMSYGYNVSEEKIIAMYENKTAKYTFDGPLKLGAIMAGADDALCDKLSAFAIPLGIAFQIRDDILGVFGDAKKTGKPVGSDIAEGKMTLMVHRAISLADRKQKKELKRLLGKKDITNKEIAIFQKILHDTGAMKSIDEQMKILINQSQKALDNITMHTGAKEFLSTLTQHLYDREK